MGNLVVSFTCWSLTHNTHSIHTQKQRFCCLHAIELKWADMRKCKIIMNARYFRLDYVYIDEYSPYIGSISCSFSDTQSICKHIFIQRGQSRMCRTFIYYVRCVFFSSFFFALPFKKPFNIIIFCCSVCDANRTGQQCLLIFMRVYSFFLH